MEWISVNDDLPKEKASVFNKFYGSDKWSRAMWRTESDKVLVAVTLPDFSRRVTVGSLRDGSWRCTISSTLNPVVTHWMLLPELPET